MKEIGLESFFSVPFARAVMRKKDVTVVGEGVPDDLVVERSGGEEVRVYREGQTKEAKERKKRITYGVIAAAISTAGIFGYAEVIGPSLASGTLRFPSLEFGNEKTNYTSWLFTTSSTGEHLRAIPNPPQGINPNGAANIHIDTNPAHKYNVWGDPTISCKEFVAVLAENHSPAAPVAAEMWYKAYVDGINPAAILGIFGENSGYGKYPQDRPSPSWRTPLESIADELFRADTTNHTPGDNSGYMDFGKFTNEKGWVVSTAYFDEWLGEYGKHDLISTLDKWAIDNNTVVTVADVEKIMGTYDGK